MSNSNNTAWLSNIIKSELANIKGLKNVKVTERYDTVVVDIDYSTNSRFDIFDSQMAINEIVKTHRLRAIYCNPNGQIVINANQY